MPSKFNGEILRTQSMEDRLKILIVDDEPEARDLLNFMLREKDFLEVVGLADSVDDAIFRVKKVRPDVVLLDIQMPGKDGFQFIEMLNGLEAQPGIIFVTAFENYAIRAIRNSAFDYLLKPINSDELFDALQRFRERRRMNDRNDISELMKALKSARPGKIKLNTRSGYMLLDPEEIVYCKADGNYTHIQLIKGNPELTTQNLGSIENLLQLESFFRISRSYLANLKYLTRVDRKSSTCTLEFAGHSHNIKIPAQKVKLLESVF